MSDLTSRVLGIGNPSGGLQKMRISTGTPPVLKVEALFNPAQISRTRAITWEQGRPRKVAPTSMLLQSAEQFVAREPETLSVDLFFDTYETHEAASSPRQAAADWLKAASPIGLDSFATSVTMFTRDVERLGDVDKELHHPPVCQLSWGSYANIFTGVLTQLDQHFNLFMPDGTPVRATVSCTFTEYITRGVARFKELHSADIDKTRVVRRGDTLHSLAAQEYNDPAQWRVIARANGIINPRRLQPGATLTIPKLDG